MVPFGGPPLLELFFFFSKFSISSSWNDFMLPLGVHLWLFFFGSILHPIATTSQFHLGSMDAFYFPIFPIWPNCNNSMDPLGISPLMIFFFFPPFSIPHFTHLQQFQWAFCGRKRTKVDITDQIRLFYDEIWTPLAMRTELTCSHEDMKTRLLFSHLLTAAMTTTTAYLYLQLPVLCTYSKLCNCGSRDCRLDQSVPRSLFFFPIFSWWIKSGDQLPEDLAKSGYKTRQDKK